MSNKRIGQPGRRAIAFMVTAMLSAGFLLLASSPQPTEAATVRCSASRTITMPNHATVAELTPNDLSQAMYGLPFPNSCQSRIKIGTYSIDVTITYSLKLTSAGGGGVTDHTWLELSLGTVSDTYAAGDGSGGIDTILTSGLGPNPYPYYNGAGADLAGDLHTKQLATNCFPSACTGSIRAVGTFNFASLDNVLAVYAVTYNCVGEVLPGQPFCEENYGNTYPPGLEGATLRFSATAVLIPLYETSR